MRTLKKNQQKMYYALFDKEEENYKLDAEGNPIVDYIDEEGNVYYKTTGGTHKVFKMPVPFNASISSKLDAIRAKEYGVEQSSIYSEITVSNGKLPLNFGDLIWRKSEIEWSKYNSNSPEPTSADYVVRGILDEFLNFDFYLLERIDKETK